MHEVTANQPTNVVPFIRYQDVTDWPFDQIRQWCRENGWVHGFRIDKRRSGKNKYVIERLRS